VATRTIDGHRVINNEPMAAHRLLESGRSTGKILLAM
jgi:hypothetical protein